MRVLRLPSHIGRLDLGACAFCEPFGGRDVDEIDGHGQPGEKSRDDERSVRSELLSQGIGGPGRDEGRALSGDKADGERDAQTVRLEESYDDRLLYHR